ncbi:MAG: transcription termination/antitermination protein NusG [Bryobacteraceae bacterium]
MYDGQTSPNAEWFAVQTKPKHEKSVSRLLEGKGYEQLLPLYQSWHRSSGRLKGVLLPLFKGYTFCQFDPIHRLPILMTPGVSGIIGRGREPEPIPREEIAQIQASCASGLQVTPWPYLERGDLVRVECGPLQGIEGIFVNEKNTSRLVVSVQILRRSVAVEVDRNWIRPIGKRFDAMSMIVPTNRPTSGGAADPLTASLVA